MELDWDGLDVFCGRCGYYNGILDGLSYVAGGGLAAACATLSAAACFESLKKESELVSFNDLTFLLTQDRSLLDVHYRRC